MTNNHFLLKVKVYLNHLCMTLKEFIIVMLMNNERSDDLMDKVSALQPRDCMFEPYTGHHHDSSYDISTG